MKNDRILYLECRSGISGDMTVAALLDLGADEEKLQASLASLPLDGYKTRISRVKKSGLDACDFEVLLDEEYENHDHDMAYLHGDMHTQNHMEHAHDGHDHDGHMHDDHGHGHDHDGHMHDDHGHGHDHDGHTHDGHEHHAHHIHRGLPQIRQIIEAGSLTEGAKRLALRVFDILADAEAKAHGVPREEVHFHEVGAVDSIVDIVAAAVCLDDLSPERVIVSSLSEGTGTVRCQHGVLPIPVPAVANIAAAYRLPIQNTTVRGELVTPTGAALAAAVMQEHNTLPEHYTIERIGVGAGKRSYDTAGILRAMWIRPAAADAQAAVRQPCAGEIGSSGAEHIVKLEAGIDDVTGEQLGYCMDCLMEAGARDVSFVPIYMKKNRPAYEVHVVCDPCDVPRMEEILFRETTTIGIRRSVMERTVMERRQQCIETPFGTARVKVCSYGDIQKVYPEYESVKELCRKTHNDFCKVYQSIVEAVK